jgi:hypothetical protein
MNEQLPGDEPRGFEDLPWRIGYRVRRGLFHIFGPPTLNTHNDPHKRLERERAARYAGRTAAQGAKRSTVQPAGPRV